MKSKITAVLVLAWAAAVRAHIINVPADCPTIQAGIDAGADNDTVLVAPGTYYENINFHGHNVVLGSMFLIDRDTSHISFTVIDGDSAGSVVVFATGENNAALIGFTIQYGRAFGGEYTGGGIRCRASSPVIADNIIRWNSALRGAGIYCHQSNPLITGNRILDNSAGGYGGGIHCIASAPTISRNLISGNWSFY